MAEPFVSDPDFTLYVGDALETLQAMSAESVHCCVTSPPYWGLRDYGTGTWEGGDADCDHRADDRFRATSTIRDTSQANVQIEQETKGTPFKDICGKCGATRVDQQLGLEPTPDQYVASMVAVFREVRRVLRADGTLWLNIGDSYAATVGGHKEKPGRGEQAVPSAWRGDPGQTPMKHPTKPKDLVGIPWRLAFALQADGWYLRSDIIWAKPNPMPESVTDRPTKAHEYLFLLTKSPRYFYDADAIREPHTQLAFVAQVARQREREEAQKASHMDSPANGVQRFGSTTADRYLNPAGRNKRSVWEIATEAYPDAHFATFPQALVEPCIKAGTSEHGCCPVCGAPWERETETDETLATSRRGTDAYQSGGIAKGATWAGSTPGVRKHVMTTGWRPSCDCGADLIPMSAPVPGVVLDPFLGSGTTAQVARRLGRRSIGIELNREYAKLAAKRLSQLSLLAGEEVA